MTRISEELLGQIQRDDETAASVGAAEAEIAFVQQSFGVAFPPSYIQFLRRFNGGEFHEVRMHPVQDLAGMAEQACTYVPTITEGKV